MRELFDRYSGIVYAVALRVLGDTGTAEDVMQEIFLQLWRRPRMYDSARGSLGAWLAVISRHRAIDVLRKRRPEVDFENIAVPFDARLEEAAARSEFAGKARAIILGLPPEQQKALQMAFFQGLTHSEIAAQTGEPLGTIKTRIRSALSVLRKQMGRTLPA